MDAYIEAVGDKKSTTTCDFQFKIRYLFYAQFEDFPCCIKFRFYSGQS